MSSHLVFMSSGTTLYKWQILGALTREISIFRPNILSGQYFSLCSYGGNADKAIAAKSNIHVLLLGPNSFLSRFVVRLPILSSIYYFLSLIFQNTHQYQSFISLQTSGAWLPLCASLLKRKRFVYRYGFDACFFTRQISGRGIIYFYFLFIHCLCTIFSSAIIVTSSLDKLRLLESFFFLSPSKVHILPNFVDTSLFSPLQGQPPSSFKSKAIFIGRISPQKCIPDVLRLASILNLSLTIIGDGSKYDVDEMHRLASFYHLDFTHLRSVSNSQLTHYLNIHTFFILMSSYEGNPKALLEAMSAGNVCIVKNSTNYDLPVIHLINGLILNSLDSSQEMSELSHQLCDTRLLSQLSVNARNTIVSSNSLPNYLSTLNSIASHE